MSTITYIVKVVSAQFTIDDGVAPKLTFRDGDTYIFDQADSTNAGHILQFSITSNNSGSAEYTTGVTKTGTAGSSGAKTTIITSSSTTDTLYYYSSGGGTYGEEFSNSGFKTSTNYNFLKPIVGGSATAEKWGSMVNHAIDQIDQNITSHAPEGTAVKSTGETGGTKFLREDGDNSSSWQAPAAAYTSSTFLDQGTLFSRSSANTLHIPDLGGVVDGTLVEITATTKDLNSSGSWDGVGSYQTASNRAGKDFYVYLLKAGGVILSATSTYPSGSTAANSRKIAGFHCLCTAAGTISGHTLTGYAQGDILPQSVWDRFNRPISAPEGMVLSLDGMWVDIYLPSVSTVLVSVNGGTIADGASSPAFHGYKFEQWFGEIGKKLIRQTEFVVASLGSNQGTNITGSADPGTTGGHSDTAGQRMISNIGCEDMCGALKQWSRDPGGVYSSGASWANAYDGNDSGIGGQHHQAPFRALLGGNWSAGSACGSRYSLWDNSPLSLSSNESGRGVAESAANRL